MGNGGKAPPLTIVFYVEIAFICSTLVFSGYGLLLKNVAVSIWLPCLLLLCSACVSLSSLIYLNKGVALRSQDNLLFYTLLTLVLIVFRAFCFCLLLIGSFSPHHQPIISLILSINTMVHTIFDVYAISQATNVRSKMAKWSTKDRIAAPVEEIAVVNLQVRQHSASRSTLVTNLDDDDLLIA